MNNFSAWDPTTPNWWAKSLGLVHVPMFGNKPPEIEGEHSVLLDGNASSFALSITEDNDFPLKELPISWSWSSNLRHSVIYNKGRNELFIRRWDAQSDFRRFEVKRDQLDQNVLNRLLNILMSAQAPKAPDVISFVLQAFRQIRSYLQTDALNAIRALNALLLGLESVRQDEIEEKDWRGMNTVGDIFKKINSNKSALIESLSGAEGIKIGALTSYFLDSCPRRFEPGLLLRHAAGQLYQEAHIRLEMDQQLYLAGLAPVQKPQGLLKRDVRFTPPNLARALVQQAMAAIKKELGTTTSLEILDPACGSGIFLQEALREIASDNRGFKGTITLKGFDSSDIACSIARFCLNRAKLECRDKPFSISLQIKECNALTENWGSPDLILMNPPFIPYDRMDEMGRNTTKDILGELAVFKFDMAMAFIWKAVKCLGSDAVMASILPAALFETQSGFKWRQAIANETEMLFLGRFENPKFFENALVEPGFFVMRRKGQEASHNEQVRVLLAKKDYSNEALRGLRKQFQTPEENLFEIYQTDSSLIYPASWMPRSQKITKMIESFSAAKMTRVQDLFSVHQGIRTGQVKAFIIASSEYQSLPRKEKRFFQQAIANVALQNCRIHLSEYVFYPYESGGPIIGDENELKEKLPQYYEKWLKPNKDSLIRRARKGEQDWWLLSEHRSWHKPNRPKLVSTFYGGKGYFAYDEKGEYAVVQGYAWLWKNPGKPKRNNENDDLSLGRILFEVSPLPWAYLALLNSDYFEHLLECFCPRVQGGQFNLATQFVKNVFLPNLDDPHDDFKIRGEIIQTLSAIGIKMHKGKEIDMRLLNEAVEQAYGVY